MVILAKSTLGTKVSFGVAVNPFLVSIQYQLSNELELHLDFWRTLYPRKPWGQPERKQFLPGLPEHWSSVISDCVSTQRLAT